MKVSVIDTGYVGLVAGACLYSRGMSAGLMLMWQRRKKTSATNQR